MNRIRKKFFKLFLYFLRLEEVHSPFFFSEFKADAGQSIYFIYRCRTIRSNRLWAHSIFIFLNLNFGLLDPHFSDIFKMWFESPNFFL